MAKKQIPVRLHRQHDMDLICLYRIKSFHLGRELKRALIAYANEVPYVVEISQQQPEKGYVPTSSLLHIVLDDEKPEEAEAIKILNGVKNGYRCSFIKSVFRGSAPYLPLIAFADGNGFVMKKQDTSETIRQIRKNAITKAVSKEEETSNNTTDVDAPINLKEQNVAEKKEQNTADDDLNKLFMQMSALNH